MPKLKSDKDKYYFSVRLKKQLERILDYRLTVVEAPSGFGKTTAVREFLARVTRGQAGTMWYTCFGESPPKAWAGICGLFGPADGDIAESLMRLGVPTLETLPDITGLLQRYKRKNPAFLVIDNYQLFKNDVPRELLHAFSACKSENVHIVVVTQPLPVAVAATHGYNELHTIGPEDFLFDKECIAGYCRLTGLNISDDDIELLHRASGGWVAAVRLQIAAYAESGAFADTSNIQPLIDAAILSKLSEAEKEFLLAISLLDGFSAQQAAIMGGWPALPSAAADLLHSNFFIRYIADKEMYSMHSILRDHLLHHFFELRPPEFISKMHRRAGLACRETGDYFGAAQFFMKEGDYDAILSLPFTDQYFFNNQERDSIQFFERVFQECPASTLLKHPLTVLVVGIQFFKKGMREQYASIVKLMEDFLKKPTGLSETELYRVKGEFEMMLFFSHFNDVAKMGEQHRKAHEYLKRVSAPPRSSIYIGNQPWAVGVPSIMSIYWNKSGGLRQALAAVGECLPFYVELTGGHSAGGDVLMRSEACLVAGDDREAETLCYKTLYDARGAGQIGNCLGAELLLARIGLLRGDEKMYSAARGNIKRDMAQARQTALTRLGEMGLAHLNMALGKTGELPEWLRHTEAIRKTLYIFAQPYAMMLHSMMLLLEESRAELYALSEPALKTAAEMHYPLLLTMHLIFLARARQDERKIEKAADHLREALAIALPDRVYLPFAEHGDALQPLLRRLQGEFDQERMEECLALCRRWSVGARALRRTLPGEFSSAALTPRQREIALLIRDGLAVKEIAAQLSLSESTVAWVRKEIYSKLNIHSNVELTKVKL